MKKYICIFVVTAGLLGGCEKKTGNCHTGGYSNSVIGNDHKFGGRIACSRIDSSAGFVIFLASFELGAKKEPKCKSPAA
jgi:hypothetical protein